MPQIHARLLAASGEIGEVVLRGLLHFLNLVTFGHAGGVILAIVVGVLLWKIVSFARARIRNKHSRPKKGST